jgi:hypothetical protein
MSNRRRSRRVPFRKRVRYGLNKPNLLGYVSNISESGIKIEGNKVFPQGTRLVIHIYVEDTSMEEGGMQEIIALEGVVSWATPTLPGFLPKMGIEISGKPDELKRLYEAKAIHYKN